MVITKREMRVVTKIDCVTYSGGYDFTTLARHLELGHPYIIYRVNTVTGERHDIGGTAKRPFWHVRTIPFTEKEQLVLITHKITSL